MEFYEPNIIEIFVQLIIAAFLGASIGIERELARKTAGMRTYALVSMGSALFAILSKFAFVEFWGVPGFDPSRIASQILPGVGFIGAGVIIFSKQEDRVKGLTTAASIWVAAAIGVTVGYRMYSIAAFTTILVLVILIFLWWLESKLLHPMSKKPASKKPPPIA